MSNTYNITIHIASLSVVMNAIDSGESVQELLYRCADAEGEEYDTGSIMAQAAEAAAAEAAKAPPAPAFTPDVDETADVTVAEVDTSETVNAGVDSDDDDVNPAYGADGKNADKLAWAKLRVVAYDDDGNMELVKLANVEDREAYHTILDDNEMAETYVNLYREANGYAKVGSSTFSSRANAGAVRRSSNLIGTVGLCREQIK